MLQDHLKLKNNIYIKLLGQVGLTHRRCPVKRDDEGGGDRDQRGAEKAGEEKL